MVVQKWWNYFFEYFIFKNLMYLNINKVDKKLIIFQITNHSWCKSNKLNFEVIKIIKIEKYFDLRLAFN